MFERKTGVPPTISTKPHIQDRAAIDSVLASQEEDERALVCHLQRFYDPKGLQRLRRLRARIDALSSSLE